MTTSRRATSRRVRPVGTGREPVVRFLLRLPAAVHRHLVARAAASHLSLNEYCVRRLGGPEAGLPDPGVLAMRDRAWATAGTHLLGIVVHGSWTRGESRTTSDVDVLVVVDRALPLTRELYRRWDGEPVTWAGRPVDVHFVHLPADPDRAGGVWCEAAVDGTVLHDRDGLVESTLRQVRRAIADGRLVRKHAHGQPYWTGAA
jgi:hypothetical protein